MVKQFRSSDPRCDWRYGWVLVALAAAGCGAETGSVHGTVTSPAGTPAERVTVTFEHVEGLGTATGMADEAGKYDLVTGKQPPGLTPGEYRVTVHAPFPEDSSQGQPPRFFPQRYEDPQFSGLTFTVAPGDNQYDIQLEAN